MVCETPLEHTPAVKAELAHCCLPSLLLHNRTEQYHRVIAGRFNSWVLEIRTKAALPVLGVLGEVGVEGNKVRVLGVTVKTAVASNVVRKRATVLEAAP